jgi:arylformamidase
MRLFDITRAIHQGMTVYEGDPHVAIRRVSSVAAGAPVNVSELYLGTHTGTHIDPPLHMCDDTPGADELPLDVLIGPARVYELNVREHIDLDSLRTLDLAGCPRILFKTVAPLENHAGGALPPTGVGLTADAAQALVEAGIRLVGLDSLSADAPASIGLPAHRTLLRAGVVILEGLDLSAVAAGAYELLCLPLRIRGGDGAPARVVLRALD